MRKKYEKEERIYIGPGNCGYYYAVYYDPDGKRHCESTGTKNALKASKRLQEMRLKANQGDAAFGRQKPVKIEELFAEFIEWYEKVRKKAPLSVHRHNIASKPVLEFFKGVSVGRITAGAIEDYIRAREKKVAPNTLRKEINLLSAMLGYAAKSARGYIAKNPVPEVENKPAIRAVNPPFALSVEETEKIVSAFKQEHHKLLFLLLISTGMRITEALNLEWGDVNFDAGSGVGEIVVRKAKRSKWRRVPLFGPLKHALLKIPNKIGRVVKHERGKGGYRRGFYNVIARVIRDTGVRPFSHHTLRHTFVSNCYQGGINDVVIASWTGHSPQVLRDIYLHLSVSDFEEIQKLARISGDGNIKAVE